MQEYRQFVYCSGVQSAMLRLRSDARWIEGGGALVEAADPAGVEEEEDDEEKDGQ